MYLGLGKDIEPGVVKPAEKTISTENTTVKQSAEPIVFTAPEWLCIGERVIHKTFGRGMIQSITDKRCSVRFDSGENKDFVIPDSLRFLRRDDAL